MKRNVTIGIGIAIAAVVVFSFIGLAVYNEGQNPINQDSGLVSPPTPGKHLQISLNESIGLEEQNP